ncbi:MAG: type II toxin-antitoxin system HicA family toxin [Bdellovibrionales bacterium]|jgi:predicted RNA binding protein YcfA (HicA-like mRNA interferase family)|nr:type II toxin-antitoxin system HicA family toxin [Bdellovibrionales bacterium]
MSTGIPRTHHEVVRAARDLGYQYDHTSGGHVFYTKETPDAKLGQEKRLVIPTDIKTEKTLRNILGGMGYFSANGLNKSGQPKRDKVDPAVEQAQQERKMQSRFVAETRAWKQTMRQHFRHADLVPHPGAAPQPQSFVVAYAQPKGLKH